MEAVDNLRTRQPNSRSRPAEFASLSFLRSSEEIVNKKAVVTQSEVHCIAVQTRQGGDSVDQQCPAFRSCAVAGDLNADGFSRMRKALVFCKCNPTTVRLFVLLELRNSD